jgi:hypothetical protein
MLMFTTWDVVAPSKLRLHANVGMASEADLLTG